MATNYQYEGETIPIVESALTHATHDPDLAQAGDAVLVGSLVGVALNSAAANTDSIQVAVEGVWALPAAAVTDTVDSAIAVGDKLYFSTAETKATGTLTSTGTAPSDGDTVTIGSTVYTFKTALTTDPAAVPYEVLIGVSAAVALDNLKSAINKTAGEGTTYGTGTTAHPSVEATTNTNTTQVVQALTAGAAGNDIASTETSSQLAWGAATLFGAKSKGDLTKTSGNMFFGTAVSTLAAGDFGTVNVLIKRAL
jgi:predicted RecA/RadA family phage recombinase